MEIGIAAAQPWKQLGDVGAAIQEHAEKNGFSVVRDSLRTWRRDAIP